jgi:hypothetical protein
VILIDAMEENLEEGLRMRWEEAVAAERVIDLIAAEFDGQDPLKPHSRAGLQHAREIAETLASQLTAAGRTVEDVLEVGASGEQDEHGEGDLEEVLGSSRIGVVVGLAGLVHILALRDKDADAAENFNDLSGKVRGQSEPAANATIVLSKQVDGLRGLTASPPIQLVVFAFGSNENGSLEAGRARFRRSVLRFALSLLLCDGPDPGSGQYSVRHVFAHRA